MFWIWTVVAIVTVLLLWGTYDVFQKKHAILHNFPIIGHYPGVVGCCRRLKSRLKLPRFGAYRWAKIASVRLHTVNSAMSIRCWTSSSDWPR